MKILVTGANGFVGSHLCQKLLSLNHTVYALVRNPKKLSLAHPNLVIISGDLTSSNLPWVKELPLDLNACIHTAGLVHAYELQEFYSVNERGTKNLISSLAAKEFVDFSFILISSLAAAGPSRFGEKKTEEQVDFPISIYGQSKKNAETVMRTFAPKNWNLSIIRPPMIIGPGDIAVLDIFKMVKSRLIILPGIDSKNKEYSFVCILDLVETIVRVLHSKKSYFLYSSHEQVVTFKELINEIKKQMQYRWVIYLPVPITIVKILSLILNFVYRFFPHNLRLTPDKIKELEASAWTCENRKSVYELGQTYQYAIEETVKITFADYIKRGWL